MAEKRLTTHYASNNIGENLFKNKPQKLCVDTHYYQKESSNKLVFQLQLLRLASYFGLMFHKKQQVPKTDSVSQVQKIGQNVITKKVGQSRSANYDKSASGFVTDYNVIKLIYNDNDSADFGHYEIYTKTDGKMKGFRLRIYTGVKFELIVYKDNELIIHKLVNNLNN